MTTTMINAAVELFGMQLIDPDAFFELLIRFALNLVVITIIVRYIYYFKTRRRDFLFTFILISTVVFLMCFLLESVKLQLGFALGLFAVFGIIRYRTTPIPIKEMTYLFIVIGLSVVNAVANKKISYSELLLANAAIIGITYYVEHIRTLESESYTVVTYEKIEFVNPERRVELITDLEIKLGIKISRIEISNVDYMRDVAKIRVYFFKSQQGSWSKDNTIDYRTPDEY
jgi:hypothetical protein